MVVRPRASWFLFAAVVALLLPSRAAAQETLLDRIVAVVDEDPILASEISQMVGLGLVQQREGETDRQLQRRTLDRLINQRLRFHEIDRYGFAAIPVEEVERRIQELTQTAGGEEAFEGRLEELGLDETEVRNLLAQQLMVMTFVEERLGPRIFISLDDIRDYYDSELVPRVESEGVKAPPIQEVREQIRSVLREQRLNEEIDRWTEELRDEAVVEDHFDSTYDELPPIVAIDSPSS